MHIQDFVKVYEPKSDEELIQLAANLEHLTSAARLALQGELARRRISIPEHSEASQYVGGGRDAGHGIVREVLPEGEWSGVGGFVAEVLRTYHSHFWLFFKMTAPAVLISTVAIITGRNEVRQITRALLRGQALTFDSALELVNHRTEMFEIYLVVFLQFLVSWMAFSILYGAICIAVEEQVGGFAPSAWRSFLSIRERLGPFLRLCLLLFVLVLVAEEASSWLVTGVFWALHKWQMRPTALVNTVVAYGVVGLLLLVISRFALAVPAVILDDCRVGQAMFRSDELTQGKWLTLAALLAKSLIGGYVAAMCPFWLASFVHITGLVPSWLPWSLTAASIIGVAVVEPPMFIGFALLYLKMSAQDTASSKVLTGQLA
jgi:hypothetical protein